MARPTRQEAATRPEARVVSSDNYTSMFYIDPAILDSEDYHYAFIERTVLGEPTQSIERAFLKGYEPVKKSDIPELAKGLALLAAAKGRPVEDEFIVKGEQILMRCARTLFNNRNNDLRSINKEKMRSIDWSGVSNPTFVENASMSRGQSSGFADD